MLRSSHCDFVIRNTTRVEKRSEYERNFLLQNSSNEYILDFDSLMWESYSCISTVCGKLLSNVIQLLNVGKLSKASISFNVKKDHALLFSEKK